MKVVFVPHAAERYFQRGLRYQVYMTNCKETLEKWFTQNDSFQKLIKDCKIYNEKIKVHYKGAAFIVVVEPDFNTAVIITCYRLKHY